MEGLVLRYLSGVYKALAQTVPDGAKDPLVWEMETYLGALLRQVDSSVLDMWEKMRSGVEAAGTGGEVREAVRFRPGPPQDVTRDEKAFVERARAGVFAALRALSQGEWATAWEALGGARPGPEAEEEMKAAMEAFRAERGRFRLDAEGRNRRHTYSVRDPESGEWRLQQMLVDPGEYNDWVLECVVDVAASRAASRPVLTWVRLGPLVAADRFRSE
jgi:hypothetical protein